MLRKRNTGLKPEFLIDSLQSAYWHFYRSMPSNPSGFAVSGIHPLIVSGTMMK